MSGSTPVLATGLVYLSIGALALVSACLLLAAKLPVAKVLWYTVAGLVGLTSCGVVSSSSVGRAILLKSTGLSLCLAQSSSLLRS